MFGEPQPLFYSAADKVEGRSAFHHEGITLVLRQNEGRRMVWRIGTPPSLPRVVLPWATDRTKHVAAKDEGPKVFHRPPCERVVHIDRSAILPMHGAKCPSVKEPLKEIWTALAQRIVQALLYPCAKTVQRNTKSG